MQAGAVYAANQASTSGGVPWWVALLSAVGALLVSVLSAWLLIYIRSRRPSRAADLEKTPPAPAKVRGATYLGATVASFLVASCVSHWTLSSPA